MAFIFISVELVLDKSFSRSKKKKHIQENQEPRVDWKLVDMVQEKKNTPLRICANGKNTLRG